MLGDDEYVGYTLHYSSPKVFQKVAAHLSIRASAGGKFRYNIYLRPLEKFLFLKAHTKMTKNAVQCFLKKDKVLTRHSCKVCFHKEESTVVDGLTDTMQLATDRSDCVYYFPARVESPLAVDADIAVTAGSDTAAGMSDGAAGSAVTAGSDISSSRVVALDGPNTYQAEFPTLYLTPTLLRRNNGLETRGQAYNICSQLISSDRGNVYSGLKGGAVVSIKCLGAHALEDSMLDRTVREIFTLEKGHDRGACFPRILDAFTKSTDTNYGFCLVFEVFGIPLDQFRTLHGYGRKDAQPCGHIRKLVKHCCRALSYLHDTLRLLHTDVTLANIIVKVLPGSLSGAISCKLGGFTLLEEASLSCFTGGGFYGGQSIGHPGRPTLTKPVAPNDQY